MAVGLKLGVRRGQPLVSDKEMRFTGERFVPGKPALIHLYQEHMTRYMFAAQFVRRKRVLDLGCGTGYGSYYLAKSGAVRVVGVDNSAEAMRFCRRRYSAKNLTFSVQDVCNLQFPDGDFDVVVAFELIEHLKDYRRMLKEARKVLARNGVLLVSTPNKRTYVTENQFHVKEFTLGEFRRTLEDSFRHVRMMFQSYPSSLAIQSGSDRNRRKYRIREIETGTSVDPGYMKGALYFVGMCAQKPIQKVKEFVYLFSEDTLLLEAWQKFEERTQWASRLDEEVKEKDARILELQKEFEERTQWALRLDKELKERETTILKLQEELRKRVADLA